MPPCMHGLHKNTGSSDYDSDCTHSQICSSQDSINLKDEGIEIEMKHAKTEQTKSKS